MTMANKRHVNCKAKKCESCMKIYEGACHADGLDAEIERSRAPNFGPGSSTCEIHRSRALAEGEF